MFESPSSVAEHPVSQVTQPESRRRVEPTKAVVPAGVVGVAMRSTADFSSADDPGTGDDDSEDVSHHTCTSFLGVL